MWNPIFIHVIILWAPVAALPILTPFGPLYIMNGGSLALTCEIDQDAAAVIWARNVYSSIVITNTTTCSFRKSSSMDTYNYSVTCDQLRRFTMVKYKVNSSDDNTTWSCQIYSLNYTDLGTSLVVKVLMHVPVGSVQQRNGSTLSLIENQSAVLVCETDACRPSASIYWMKDGVNITNSTTSVTAVSVGSDLFVSIGTLTYTGQRGDNRKILTCGAYNGPDSVQTSGNLTLTIYYPPFIQGLTSSYRVMEFQSLSVTCQVSSNPPPDQIFWTPAGEGSAPSRLYFNTVSRNNSGIYRCTAQNTMTPTAGRQQNGTNTSQILVDVLYAARITKFVAKGNISEILENSSLVLYCHVESNPYSVISLSFGDILISTIQNSNEMIHNTTAGCLDAGRYICSATNSVMNGVAASEEISLKVQCGPRLDHRKNTSTVYYRALNDNVAFEVNVIAYPEPADIMWYHRGDKTDKWQQVPNHPTFSSGLFSTITVHLGSPADFGDYLVNMTNSFGIYDLIFQVIQESPPQLVDMFYISRFISNQIELYFKPGFNGYRVQTFVIEYKSTASPDLAWRNSSVTDLKETQTTNGTYNVNVTQPPPGNYEYRMYSWNDIGRSPYSAVIPIFIPEGTCKTSCADTMENTKQNTLLVIAAVLFSLAACLCVAAIVLVIHSRRCICSGCMNGRSSEMDPKLTDIGLGQPSIYDDLSTLHASASGKTQDDYDQLNHGNTAGYEEPSKGSESQSKFGNHLYGNTTITSNM